MKTPSKYILYLHIQLVCMLFCGCVLAQTRNIWPLSTNFTTSLNFNTYPLSWNDSPKIGFKKHSAICNEKGNLLFYASEDTIWNSKHEVMKNGILKKDKPYNDNRCNEVWGFPVLVMEDPGNPSDYYVFFVGTFWGYVLPSTCPKPLHFVKVNMEADGGLGEVIDNEWQQLGTSFNYQLAVTKHPSGDGFWLHTKTLDTLFAYWVNSSGIAPPVKSTLKTKFGPGASEFSRDGKLLITTAGPEYSGLGKFGDSSYILTYDFNPITGKFSNYTVFDRFAENYKIGNDIYYEHPTYIVFSPNDTFIYIYNEGFSPPDRQMGSTIWQYDRFSDNPANDKYTIQFKEGNEHIIQLTPHGEIIMPHQSGGTIKTNSFSAIEKPDRKGIDCKPVAGKYPYPIQYPAVPFTPLDHCLPAMPMIDFKRVNYVYTYECELGFKLYNQSHKDFKTFTWYFQGEDTLTGYNVSKHFDTPGKYGVLLKATTEKGWSAWYNDTVEVKPEHIKPVANFDLTTTKGCKYVAFRFTDKSTSYLKDNITLTWNFGDGSPLLTSNSLGNSIEHIYTKEGSYTVTLVINNGFCTDTFRRVNEVIIEDAPKPGILADKLSGCAPLSVTFSNTSTNAIRKTYTYGNGDKTDCLTGSQDCDNISYTFTSSGTYTVIQELEGSTGCIVTDSITINVLNGFITGQIGKLTVASVLTDNSNAISWQPINGATEYTLYRNGTEIYKTVNNTSYIDNNVSNIQPYTYHVIAKDTCKNIIETNIGRTIHLSGESIENNYSLITWNGYEQWELGVFEYTLEAESKDGNFIPIANLSGNYSDYKDDDFANGGTIEKCYRIVAKEDGVNGAISYSNTLCLPYQPIIWVPTSFSPNADGINDTWQIVSFGIATYHLEIYNRWGEKVFESESLDTKWDGADSPTGTYLYIIKARGKTGKFFNLSGDITLVR